MKVTVKGLEELTQEMGHLFSSLSDLRKPFNIIKAKMHREIIKHFEEERGPDSRWERWHWRGRILNYRPYGRGGNKILQDTGRLKGGFAWNLLPLEIRVFNEIDYASYHQFGTRRMVARPFLWFEDRSIENWANTVVNFILRRLI